MAFIILELFSAYHILGDMEHTLFCVCMVGWGGGFIPFSKELPFAGGYPGVPGGSRAGRAGRVTHPG